jgi:hypothetical protein
MQSANFFINYVMLLAFGGWGAALLQVVRLVMVWVKLKWLAKTPREREAAMNPGPFRYSAAYGVDLLVSGQEEEMDNTCMRFFHRFAGGTVAPISETLLSSCCQWASL